MICLLIILDQRAVSHDQCHLVHDVDAIPTVVQLVSQLELTMSSLKARQTMSVQKNWIEEVGFGLK